MPRVQQLIEMFIVPALSRLSLVAAVVASCSAPAHAAVEFIGVTKGETFQQTSDAPPSTPNSLFGFMDLTASSSADLTAAQVTTNDVVPSPLSPFTLAPLYPGTFTFYKGEASLAALDTDFPNNALYTFSLSGGTLGAQSTFLLVPPTNLFPSQVPAFSSATFDQLQGMNPAVPFQFTWNGYTPAANINVASTYLQITNVSGDPGANYYYSGSNTLTSQVLPAGSLVPGATYQASLTYDANIVAPDYVFPGANSIVSYSIETDVVFTAGGSGPSNIVGTTGAVVVSAALSDLRAAQQKATR